MKIKDGFMLSRVAGSYVVVPVGAVQADFTGMITLNPVGAFLWGKLEKETTRDELLKSVLSQYDTDEKTAAQDIDRYLEKLRKNGLKFFGYYLEKVSGVNLKSLPELIALI